MARLVLLCFVLLCTTASAATPVIQSHRGGPVRDGEPAYGEETLSAFKTAFEEQRTVLELDVKITSDGVPVVIHDDTLDRTTPCTGAVDAKTWDQIRTECPTDLLGTEDLITADAPRPEPMIRLIDILRYAKTAGATVNVEIKNFPGENDFDAGTTYADTVLDVIAASGIPLEQVIVQSFWPTNLERTKQRLPGVATSFLSGLGIPNEAGVTIAATGGHTWWSPQWPVSAALIEQAHAQGLKVVPFTIDDEAGVKAAAAAGVDALITNDPVMANRALGIEVPGPPKQATATVRTTRATVTGRKFTVKVRTTGALTRKLTARRGKRVLARGTLKAKAAGTHRVRLRLTGAGVAALRDGDPVRVTVAGTKLRLGR